MQINRNKKQQREFRQGKCLEARAWEVWLRNSKRASVARVWVKNLEGNELREVALQNMGVLNLSPSVEWRVIEELWAEQLYDLIMFPKDKSDALSRLD